MFCLKETNIIEDIIQVLILYACLKRRRLYHTRIEEFAEEKMDLALATRLEFDTPLADLTDVQAMMDSINVIPGLICWTYYKMSLCAF